VKIFRAGTFCGSTAWASELLADFGEVTVRLHWTDQPYRWHRNTGPEVFAVLDGKVDMIWRENGKERTVHLNAGEGVSVEPGDEHIAVPHGEARILVIERKDSE